MALFARRGVVRQARKTKAESSEDEEGLQQQDQQLQEQQHQQPRAAVLKAAAAAAAGTHVSPHQAAAMAQTADSIRRSAALTAAKSHAAAAAVAAALPAELQLVDANFEADLREIDESEDSQEMLLQQQQQQQQYQPQQPKKKLLAAGACAVGSSRVFAQQQQQQQVLLQQQQAAAASAKAQRLSFGFADEETPIAQRGAAAAVREFLEEELPVGKPARLSGSKSSSHKGSSRGSNKGGSDSRRSASNSSRDAEVRGNTTSSGSRGSQEKSLLVVNPPGSVGIVLKATHGGSTSSTGSSSSSSSSSSKRHEFTPTSKVNTSRLTRSSKSSRSDPGGTENSAPEARRREVESAAAALAAPAGAPAAAATDLTVESRIFSLAEIEARGSAAAVAAAAAVEEVPDLPFAALAQVARRSRQQARVADSTISTSSNKKSVTAITSYGGNGSDDESAPTGNSSSSNSWLAKEAMMQLRAGRLLQQLSADDEEQAALEAWEREQIMKGAGRKQLLLQQQKLERRQRQQQEQLQQQQEQLILSSFTGILGPLDVSAASPPQGPLGSTSNSNHLVRPAPEPQRAGGLHISPETAADCFRQLWASNGTGTASSSSAEQQAAAAVAWIEEQAELRAEEQEEHKQQQQQQVQYKKAAATRLTALEVKQLNEKRPAVKMAVEALHELEAAEANRTYGPRLKQRQQQQPLGNVLRQLRGAPNPASAEAIDLFAASRTAASAAAAGGGGGEVDASDLGRCECWAEVLDSALFTSDEEGPVVPSSSNSSTKRHKTQRQFLQAAAEIFADVLPKYKEVRCIVEAFAAACRSCPEDLAALQQQVPLLQQLERCAETICSWELLWWLPMDVSLAPTTPAIAAAVAEWLKQQQQDQEQQQQQELQEATSGEKEENSGSKLENAGKAKDSPTSDGTGASSAKSQSAASAEDPASTATAASAATAATAASAAIAAAFDSGSGPLHNGSVVGGRILRGGPDVADFDFVKSIFAFSQEMEALSESCSTNSSGGSSVNEVAAAFSDILLLVVKDVVFPRAVHALQQTDCCSFTAAAAAAALLQEMLLFRAPSTEAAVTKMLQLFVTSFLSTLDSQLPVHCVTRALQQHQQHQQQQQQQGSQEATEAGQPQQVQQEAFAAAVEVYVHRTLKAVGVTAFFEGIISEPLLLHICMHLICHCCCERFVLSLRRSDNVARHLVLALLHVLEIDAQNNEDVKAAAAARCCCKICLLLLPGFGCCADQHLFELRLQPLLHVLPQRNALLAIHGFVRLLPVKRLLLLQQQQQQQQHLLLVNSCLTLGADLTDETDRAELLLLLHRISPQEVTLSSADVAVTAEVIRAQAVERVCAATVAVTSAAATAFAVSFGFPAAESAGCCQDRGDCAEAPNCLAALERGVSQSLVATQPGREQRGSCQNALAAAKGLQIGFRAAPQQQQYPSSKYCSASKSSVLIAIGVATVAVAATRSTQRKLPQN
ncbi:hypothetical protein Emag_003909 [Eimeria magna]